MSKNKDVFGIMDAFGLSSDSEESDQEVPKVKAKQTDSHKEQEPRKLEMAPAQMDFTKLKNVQHKRDRKFMDKQKEKNCIQTGPNKLNGGKKEKGDAARRGFGNNVKRRYDYRENNQYQTYDENVYSDFKNKERNMNTNLKEETPLKIPERNKNPENSKKTQNQ